MDEPFTIEEKNRVSKYIVGILVDAYFVKQIHRDQVRMIAQDVLQTIDGIQTTDEVQPALTRLSEMHPILKNAQLQNMIYVDEKQQAQISEQVARLMQEGKMQEAADVARQYTQKAHA